MIKICRKCNKEFNTIIKKNGKTVDSYGRVFCWECSTLGRGKRKDPNNYDEIKNLKRCCYCKEFLPMTLEFFPLQHKAKTNLTYLGIACKKCRNTRVKERALRIKKNLVNQLGGKCIICGYDKHLGSLHFHHLDPKEKEFGFGKMNKNESVQSIQDELKKCILLCANCHKETHDGLHPEYLKTT